MRTVFGNRSLARAAAIAALAALLTAAPVTAATVFFQGFETDTAGWLDFGGTTTRVSSGTGGIVSKTGDYHAEMTGSFTRWGGYGFTPGCSAGCAASFPAAGYNTSVSVYLDVDAGYANDTRFDYSSAINDPAGNHRRDFIFSGGFYNDESLGNRFMFTVSNNSVGWPRNPARDPFTITETGWYTLLHEFRNDGAGVLAVHMSILDADGSTLKTWTLSDPSDVIGTTVGGNRYGWFIAIAYSPRLSPIAVDDTRLDVLMEEAVTKEQCKSGGWQSLARADQSTFKNQGDCIQYVNTGK